MFLIPKTELMTLSISSYLQHCFQDMKYPNYLVQSVNISNKLARNIEKNVINVVDDVMSSHGVVVKNAFSLLWSVRDIIL